MHLKTSLYGMQLVFMIVTIYCPYLHASMIYIYYTLFEQPVGEFVLDVKMHVPYGKWERGYICRGV